MIVLDTSHVNIDSSKKCFDSDSDQIRKVYFGNTLVYQYDATAPVLKITSFSEKSLHYILSTSTTLSGTVTDTESSIASVKVNGVAATVSGSNWSYPVTGLTTTVKKFTVVATDEAGNTSSTWIELKYTASADVDLYVERTGGSGTYEVENCGVDYSQWTYNEPVTGGHYSSLYFYNYGRGDGRGTAIAQGSSIVYGINASYSSVTLTCAGGTTICNLVLSDGKSVVKQGGSGDYTFDLSSYSAAQLEGALIYTSHSNTASEGVGPSVGSRVRVSCYAQCSKAVAHINVERTV